MKINNSMQQNGFNTNAQVVTDSRPIDALTREWLTEFQPLRCPFGLAGLERHVKLWQPGADYVIAGAASCGSDALALTLAQNFIAGGGHVVWVGVTEDMARICERLTFKVAGVPLDPEGTQVELDAVTRMMLLFGHNQVREMWADFCDVNDCGDVPLEESFMASVSTFKPTLILVEKSIFDETTISPFEVLVRQTHALRMVEKLRKTNPLSTVLWHLPLAPTDDKKSSRPSLCDLPGVVASINPDVVLLTHRTDGLELHHNAELIIAANTLGTTGAVKMKFDACHSHWS